jgi:hypothetical protein
MVEEFGLDVTIGWYFYTALFESMYEGEFWMRFDHYEDRIAFLEYHLNKHKGKELAFLSFIEHAMIVMERFFSSYFFSIPSAPVVKIRKKEINTWIQHKHTLFSSASITKEQPISHKMLAFKYFFILKSKVEPGIGRERGLLQKIANQVKQDYGLSPQAFLNEFTKVNNPKTGESFRKQRKNLYIYDWIIKELKGDIQAQEIAKLERLDMLSQR